MRNKTKPAAQLFQPNDVAPAKVTHCPSTSSTTTNPGSFRPRYAADAPAAQIPGSKRRAVGSSNQSGRKCQNCSASMASTTAARDPTVPGAMGNQPQPNQVAIASAILFIFVDVAIQVRGIGWRRNNIFFHRPISKINNTAAVTAKGHKLRIHGLLADWALHRLKGAVCGREAARIGNGFSNTGVGSGRTGASINSPTRS